MYPVAVLQTAEQQNALNCIANLNKFVQREIG
jgi:hypothetical protein